MGYESLCQRQPTVPLASLSSLPLAFFSFFFFLFFFSFFFFLFFFSEELVHAHRQLRIWRRRCAGGDERRRNGGAHARAPAPLSPTSFPKKKNSPFSLVPQGKLKYRNDHVIDARNSFPSEISPITGARMWVGGAY